MYRNHLFLELHHPHISHSHQRNAFMMRSGGGMPLKSSGKPLHPRQPILTRNVPLTRPTLFPLYRRENLLQLSPYLIHNEAVHQKVGTLAEQRVVRDWRIIACQCWTKQTSPTVTATCPTATCHFLGPTRCAFVRTKKESGLPCTMPFATFAVVMVIASSNKISQNIRR